MSPTPLVSVLILNLRNARQTVRCVRSLLQQTIVYRLEIIVIDNHSEDDSIGILRRQLKDEPRVRIVETPRNLGFGGGYAAGAQVARGTYLFINNPDKMPASDALEKLVAKITAEPDIGILAPQLLHGDGTSRLSPRGFPQPLDVVFKRTTLRRFFPARMERYLQFSQGPDLERDTDWVAGGCFLIPRVLFEQLGGFDRRFFLFFEDTDLCRRCWMAGRRVHYFPAATVMDKPWRLSEGGALSLVGTKVGRIHLASAVRYFTKWRNRPFPRTTP